MAWTPMGNSKPTVCGHRGAAAVAPENTLASFEAALNRGATWVEFDVRPTADLALVIHHDPNTAFGQNVAGSRRDELDEKIPVFGELVEALPELGLDLEMKTDDIGIDLEQFVELVAAEVDTHLSSVEKLIVTSFDVQALALMRRLRPDIATGLLFHDHSGEWAIETAIDVGHVAIAPRYSLVTAELVNEAKEADLAVVTWTVNDPGDIARVAAAGVDMIIGDDPAIIVSQLDR